MKANNKYMKNYDPAKPSKYISYLDMNNLCDWGMSGYLPYGEFKWLKNVVNFDTMSIHWLQKNLQFLMTCCQVIAKKIAGKYKIKASDVKKLIPNLGDKTNYVAHYRNLQLYLSLGIKLTKIHKVLKFKQSD